jgi:hypothetical protein
MSNLYTVEVTNNSGSADKVYNLFSAKSVIQGGGNTADTTKSIVWFRSRKLAAGGQVSFRFDNSFYGFMGSVSGSSGLGTGSIIDTQTYKKITVGTQTRDGTILILDGDSSFEETNPDDENPAPGNGQFSIATSSRLQPYNDVIGVARGKSLGAGITPAPVNCVPLKAGVTYTFTVNSSVYVKAASLTEGSVQPALDGDREAIQVKFPAGKKKASVVEDSNGKLTVTYSPGNE